MFCICLLMLMSIISSCGVSQDKKNIYNDNDKILQERDSFNYRLLLYIEDSADKINIKYSGFYGKVSIWNFESEENAEVTFKYNSTVDRGDFKVVLIKSDDEIENILIGNEQGEKNIKLDKGKYTLKIVGRNANGKAVISINNKQNVVITRNGVSSTDND